MRAHILTNRTLSAPFSLGRGTWQGCPLSPALFALTLEPLAAHIRRDPETKGIKVGPLEEKLSLYTDDSLLYLADASASLKAALVQFDTFSCYSGIRINWDKSVLFPLHPSLPRADTHTPLRWVEEFTYLGVKVGPTTGGYLDRNVLPVLDQLTKRCTTWCSLALTPVGRGNLI